MPSAVQDRTTRSHEHVFMFSKSKSYFYDIDAIREPFITGLQPWTGDSERAQQRSMGPMARGEEGFNHQFVKDGRVWGNPLGKNKRSVWRIPTASYEGAHTAVFPPDLPEICIKAGTSEHGACSKCGRPYHREYDGETFTWEKGCKCADSKPIPSVVLDPFAGSGTTLYVAAALRRSWVGIEVNPEYEKLIQERLEPASGWDVYDFAMELPNEP